MKISAGYDMISILLAAGATLPSLAIAAAETKKKRYVMEPKFQLKFGPSGLNETNRDIQKSG
jgi:hypothetical protein